MTPRTTTRFPPETARFVRLEGLERTAVLRAADARPAYLARPMPRALAWAAATLRRRSAPAAPARGPTRP